ncbi:MAG: zinc-dependent dehydrogenase [bacterium]|nr:zinc-dependent dehydrogenase [bacterium]
MRVAMYYSNNDIRLENMATPHSCPEEILVKVEASGICGSDVMEWYRIHKVPLVLGHEIAGTIVEIGNKVTKYNVGDRVSVSHHVPCNNCHYCLNKHHTVCETLRSTNFYPGGFSEYIQIPAINVDRGVYLLPDQVSFDEGTFIEPLACVIRGQQIANIKPHHTVLVIGSGIAGLLHIHLAKAMGVNRIIATDISDYRLEAALNLGADFAFSAQENIPSYIRQVNDGYLADIILLCTGAVSAINQAFQSIERGGTILFFAPTAKDVTIPLSINDTFWRTEITLTTSYAGNRADHIEALNMIASKRVNVSKMITHRLPLSDTQKGFQLVIDAQDSIKVIIEPQK